MFALLGDCFSAPPFERITNATNRFYVNLLIQTITVSACLYLLVALISFYMGICWYIDAMVDDIRLKVEDADGSSKDSDNFYMQSVYVEQIRFHSDILQ